MKLFERSTTRNVPERTPEISDHLPELPEGVTVPDDISSLDRSSVWPPRWFRDRRRVDLAAWLVRAGDIVVQYPAAELDSNRRLGLAAVVDGLLKAAREGGVDVSLCVETDDPAVALHRMLGRLAAQTAGNSIPVSRHRARTLQTALDEFVQGSAEPDADQATDRAA
jgi:hypothetical protein